MNDKSIFDATDIPGAEQMRDLVDEARNPTQVLNIKLIDVSYIKDSGVRAIVALAASCGWNVVRKPGQMVTIVSRTGAKLRMPTDTSIKFSVFVSWVNRVITYSLTHVPTMELVNKLVKQYKLDESHARVFRQVLDQPAPEPEPELEEQVDERLDAVAEAVKEEAPEPEPEPEPPSAAALDAPFSERVEPTLNQAGDGYQYVSEIMDTVYRQLVADGDEQVTYRCRVCALEFSTKRGCGSHYQRHVQAGEAEATAGKPRVIVNKITDYVPTEIHTPRVEGLSVELRRLRKIVKDVQLAVGQDALAEYERRYQQTAERLQEVTIERDEAVSRANRLANDLRSLRELIHGLSDE